MKRYSIIMYLKNTPNNLFKKNFYRKDEGFVIIQLKYEVVFYQIYKLKIFRKYCFQLLYSLYKQF